jgi:hypothetical protein
MKRMICIVLGISLTACQSIHTFVQDHPKAAGITAAVIVGSLAASAGGSSGKAREIGVPSSPCGNPEACR